MKRKPKPFVTVNEAAEILGVSRDTIVRRIKDGTIDGDEEGGRWVIFRTPFTKYCKRLRITTK